MATLSPIAPGTYDATNSTFLGGVTGTEPVLEVIASANDLSWIADQTNGTGTETAYLDLGNMPSDFSTMDSLSYRVRYGREGGDSGSLLWQSLTIQIYRSDRSTALTDEMTINSGNITAAAVTSGTVSFTNTDTSAGKSVWDAAIVAFRITKNRSKGGFGNNNDVIYAAEVSGAYTASAVTNTSAASLSGAVAIAQSAAAALAAAVQQARSAQLSADAAIVLGMTSSTSADAAIASGASAAASVDAALSIAQAANAGLEAAIQLARISQSSTDAAIEQARAVSAATSAAISATRAATTGTDAAILSVFSSSAALNAHIRRTGAHRPVGPRFSLIGVGGLIN